MFSRIHIDRDQIGLWYRRGRFLRSLGPGDYPLVVFEHGDPLDRIDVIASDDPRREEAERHAPGRCGECTPTS